MIKKLGFTAFGIILGILGGGYIVFYTSLLSSLYTTTRLQNPVFQKQSTSQKNIIGFLPYWLLDKAHSDYSPYITTLSYFGLVIDTDGTILKLNSPTEEQPGWNGLHSGKAHTFFDQARVHHVSLSLVINSGDNNAINTLMDNPILHARNLVTQIKPLIQQYGFSDINLDIEYTQHASNIERAHFTQFVKEVKNELGKNTTVTVDVSTLDVIKKNLIDVQALGSIADYIVIMAYDYHSPDSYVTGPVAPLGGAGIMSEYDVTTAVEKTIGLVPSQKIIVGMPLYGYEWETITNTPRSSVIPGTGVIASNQRTEDFLASCTTCSTTFDKEANEAFLVYKNPQVGDYHQFFYPTQQSTQSKISLANQENLGGVALWALGYEGSSILDPLKQYKNSN